MSNKEGRKENKIQINKICIERWELRKEYTPVAWIEYFPNRYIRILGDKDNDVFIAVDFINELSEIISNINKYESLSNNGINGE